MEGLVLVNYKPFAGHDGCRGYNVDLKFNGKKVASAYDDAWGGGVLYEEYDKKGFEALLAVVEKECKGKHEKLTYSAQVLLEIEIYEHLKVLDLKKDEKKGILCKRFNSWEIYGWDVQLPTFIKKYKDGLKGVQDYYNQLKAEGKEILNGEYLESIGVVL